MASDSILFPVGRVVQGSFYEARTTNDAGEPLVYKTGDRKGQPRKDFMFAVAVPKEPGHTHWAQTAWGSKIWAEGHLGNKAAGQVPGFAWKIVDGDSATVDKGGRAPKDKEGFAGCWVVRFSGSTPPKLFTQASPGVFTEITAPGVVQRGYWVQVSATCGYNNQQMTPGVYNNYQHVLFNRADAVIVGGVDPATAFAGAAVSQPLANVAAVQPVPAQVAAPAPPVPAAPVAVSPHPGILPVQPPSIPPAPGAAALPPMPPVPPSPPVPPTPPAEPAMSASAQAAGYTYQALKAVGWTDDQMAAAGYLA